MNSKEWLIELCKEKDQLIKTETGFSGYIIPEDLEELANGRPFQCDRIARQIIKNIKRQHWCQEDCELCPWCILYPGGGMCETCQYGQRHGQCDQEDSTYRQLQQRLREIVGRDGYPANYISNIPGADLMFKRLLAKIPEHLKGNRLWQSEAANIQKVPKKQV